MKNNVNDSLSRSHRLVRAIAAGEKLRPELQVQLREWFLDVPENGAAEEALCRWAEENIKAITTAPDMAERGSFRALATRLRFTMGKDGRPIAPLREVRRPTPLRRIAMRAAAILVPIAVVLGLTFYFIDVTKTRYSVIAVHEGERETFELPDGSTVMMEGPSRLIYPNDFANNRNAELDGRAFFNVVPNPKRPFTVRHDAMEVRVLGTEFSVSANSVAEAMQVVLEKGSVAVRYRENRIVLDPGKKLTLDKTSSRVELTEATPGEILRLRGEDISIDRLSVWEALRLTADYFGKELQIDPEVPTADNISLVLPERASLESVLTAINFIFDSMVCRTEGDVIRVSEKNNNPNYEQSNL